MNFLKSIGQDEWNESYSIGGNVSFYPNEEVVRFLNRYIKKRRGISEFEKIMDIDEDAWRDFKSLDLGCGIGRHMNIMEEFSLQPYGIDLSETAIEYGKKWFDSKGKHDVSMRMQVASVTDLPFEDGFFDLCVSQAVLDSMPRDIAKQGIAETYRTLKEHGLFFLSLIMDSATIDEDVVVNQGYEKNTIQSYFTESGIEDFLKGYFDIVDIKIVSTDEMYYGDALIKRLNENLSRREDGKWVNVSRRAFIVAKRKSTKE